MPDLCPNHNKGCESNTFEFEKQTNGQNMRNQSHPKLCIKVEGLPKDWDNSVLQMAFDNPDLGGGEIDSINGDVIMFKDPKGKFPVLLMFIS